MRRELPPLTELWGLIEDPDLRGWKQAKTIYPNAKSIEFTLSTRNVCVLAVLGIVIAYLWRGWQLALAVLLVTIIDLAWRQGHREGFLSGFEAGAQYGVREALQITDADLKDIQEVLYESGYLPKRATGNEQR